MSNISPQGEQSTSSEIRELTALNNLAITPSGQAIAKTGALTFANVSAAGGLSVEIPVGTVNGVNAQFTVQSLPVFIEVSGQVLVSKDSDSTNYGYTLTGTGAYVITFVNAPPSGQTPHSFHN